LLDDRSPGPAAILARFLHFEAIPADWHDWHVNVTSPAKLALTFAREREGKA
jgi:hypothetical protein